MKDSKHIIIFSHGFGVKKDDLGMLTDLAGSFSDVECVLFDYFDVDEVNKVINIKPFSEQIKNLSQVYEMCRKQNPQAVIDIIGHSQGCITAPLAMLVGVRKIVLLNPPFDMDIQRTLYRYNKQPEAEINLEGVSILPRLDGYLRLIPREYWIERASLKKPFEIFNECSKLSEVIVFNANQDSILGEPNITGLDSKIKVLALDGDHNFNGEYREPLKKALKEILCL